MWPPNKPDSNPMNNYVWGVVESEYNRYSYSTIVALKTNVVEVMSKRKRKHLIADVGRFGARIEAIIENKDGFIE